MLHIWAEQIWLFIYEKKLLLYFVQVNKVAQYSILAEKVDMVYLSLENISDFSTFCSILMLFSDAVLFLM